MIGAFSPQIAISLINREFPDLHLILLGLQRDALEPLFLFFAGELLLHPVNTVFRHCLDACILYDARNQRG